MSRKTFSDWAAEHAISVILAGLTAAAGIVGWMTKIAYDTGSTKAVVETKLDVLTETVRTAHEDTKASIGRLESRVDRLFDRRKEVSGILDGAKQFARGE